MRNKVEITGVNTLDLKVLPQEEMMELIQRSQSGDMEARDILVEGNLKLVLSVVKKFNNRGEDLDDLFQVGAMGLIKAIDNFDFSHGVKFSTYAVPMIIGEIRRYLRDNSVVRISRSIKDTAYKALQFKEKYFQSHGMEPSIEMIAQGIEMDMIDVIIALEAIQEPVSIYSPIYSNGGDEIYLIDQIADTYETEEQKLNQMIINEGIAKLNERLKGIIYSRYYDNKTQMEIAEELGISQAQVSRLEKSALKIIFDQKDKMAK
ncbi:MAG: SigB/SigF/SigG family RNA polymerase sigma factor [Prevotella sp.]|nr:SigB/SigF/SigG family RNA polymerase sigma factor [Staphylococcus sp.]MCM1351079.1 SigB/SigF/SigG family RNA polymerase sigma factor [Prevotella sp.]